MTFIVANRRFSPGLFTSVLTCLVFMAFIKLGFWQLDRAEYKRNLYQSFLTQQQAEPVQLTSIDFSANVDALLWKQVTANGVFSEDFILLLDNQTRKGKQGYLVYALFQPAGFEKLLLVNQGWIAAGLDRTKLPELNEVNQTLTISGVLKATPNTGILLEDVKPEKMAQNIYRLQKMDLNEIAQFIGSQLLPVVLQMDDTNQVGYDRQWVLPGSDEKKHFGYAFQWFAFAITLLVIYITVNFKKID